MALLAYIDGRRMHAFAESGAVRQQAAAFGERGQKLLGGVAFISLTRAQHQPDGAAECICQGVVPGGQPAPRAAG